MTSAPDVSDPGAADDEVEDTNGGVGDVLLKEMTESLAVQDKEVPSTMSASEAARRRGISMAMAREFERATKVGGPATPRGNEVGMAMAGEFLDSCTHRGQLDWYLDGGWVPSFVALREHYLYLFKGTAEKDAATTDPTHVVNLRTIASPKVAFGSATRVFAKDGRDSCFSFEIPRAKCTLAAPNSVAANAWCDQLLTGASLDAMSMTLKSIKEGDERGVAEAARLTELKKSLPAAQQAKLGSNYFYSDVSLLRHLDMKKGDVKKARDQLVSNALWRQQMCLDSMTIAHTVDKVAVGTFLCPGVCDLEGRPIIFVNGKHLKPAPDSTLHLTRCLTYALEQATTFFQPDGPHEITFVANLEGISVTNFDERFERLALDIFLSRFPGCAQLGLFVNVPAFVRWFMKTLTTFMPAYLRKKIHMFKGGVGVLAHFVDVSSIPHEHFGGGDTAFTCAGYIAQRAALEGVQIGPDSKPVEQELDAAIHAQLKTLYCGAKELPDVVKAGYLSKQGGLIKNWKKRYFVLRGGILYYFKDDTSVNPQGTVLLENVMVEAGTKANSAGKANAMLVITPIRTYIIICASAAERDEWIEAVKGEAYAYDGN